MHKTIPFVFNQLDIFTYQVRPDSKLCFDFSLPVDKSHLEELESEKEEEEVAKHCPTKENVKDAEEDYGEADKGEDKGQCEEAGDESADDFEVCSDESLETKGADDCSRDDLNNHSKDDLNNYSKDQLNNYSKDDLNNSVLFSDKFELSLSEDFDSGAGTQAKDLSDELFIEDLTEAEREIEDSIGSRALSKIDPHYYSSPRLVMRGEYISDVINLKVKRKPVDGTYVNWFMVNKETKDIILNVKAEMTYSYDVHGVQNRAKKDGADDGASYSKRVPSGRIWYGYVSLILINVFCFTLLHVRTGMDMGLSICFLKTIPIRTRPKYPISTSRKQCCHLEVWNFTGRGKIVEKSKRMWCVDSRAVE